MRPHLVFALDDLTEAAEGLPISLCGAVVSETPQWNSSCYLCAWHINTDTALAGFVH